MIVTIGRSSNGRTIDSGSIYLGSNPSLPAMKKIIQLFFGLLSLMVFLFFVFPDFFSSRISYVRSDQITDQIKKIFRPDPSPLDTIAYDKKLNELANNPQIDELNKDSTMETAVPNTHEVKEIPLKNNSTSQPVEPTLWPVKTVYPNAGAILPFKRIVAYYGNLYSKQMGVLGQYGEAEMLSKLDVEVKKWEEADKIRAQIEDRGYQVEDTVYGPFITKK